MDKKNDVNQVFKELERYKPILLIYKNMLLFFYKLLLF